MKSDSIRAALVSLLALSLGAACANGDPEAPSEPTPEQPAIDSDATGTTPGAPAVSEAPSAEAGVPAEAMPPAAPPADTLCCTVNGEKIVEQDITDRFEFIVAQQTGGQPLPPEQLAMARAQMHGQILDELIAEKLLDADVADAGLELSDDEIVTFLQLNLDSMIARNPNMTRETLESLVQQNEGMSIDEYTKKQATDPGVRAAVLQAKLIEARFPEECTFTDEAVQEACSELATVEASHILIGTEGMTTDEEKAEARAKAEEIVGLARAEGADFAELAKEHSTGPSGPSGGALGSFPRNGVMVEPFAAAAFELEVGGVSDVVETQFGYHVIKVTARDEPSLDDAGPRVRQEMLMEKVMELRQQHVEALKAKATIEYPGAESADSESTDSESTDAEATDDAPEEG